MLLVIGLRFDGNLPVRLSPSLTVLMQFVVIASQEVLY